MGQVSRINRAQRFIDEFGADFLARNSLVPGAKYTYVGSHLSMKDGSQDEVVLVHRFKADEGGQELGLEDEVLFDPEYQDGDDLLDNEFHGRLGITHEQLAERIKKADL